MNLLLRYVHGRQNIPVQFHRGRGTTDIIMRAFYRLQVPPENGSDDKLLETTGQLVEWSRRRRTAAEGIKDTQLVLRLHRFEFIKENRILRPFVAVQQKGHTGFVAAAFQHGEKRRYATSAC